MTEQDRAHVDAHPAPQKRRGHRPAVLAVDLYRWAFGDKPEPLLKAVDSWPGSCGLAGWEAIPHIQRLLQTARSASVPVIFVTGMDVIPNWRSSTTSVPAVRGSDPAAADRLRRRYDIIGEVMPLPGEPVIRKSAPSAFWGTPLAGFLNGLRVDTVVVAGESTSGCVRATVVDACSYRFKVVVPEECVFDRHEAAHAMNLFDMDQKYADVVGLEDVLDYLGHGTRDP